MPSDLCEADAGTARSEPPRKDGMAWPLMWLGIGKALMTGARAGLPAFGSVIRPTSQPLPIIAATCPCENVVHSFASVPVLSARDRASTSFFSSVRPARDFLELRLPFQLPPLLTA